MKRSGGGSGDRGMYMLALVFVLGAVGLAYGLLTLDTRTDPGTASVAATPAASVSGRVARKGPAAAACRKFVHDRIVWSSIDARDVVTHPGGARAMRDMTATTTALNGMTRSGRTLIRALPSRHLSVTALAAYAGWQDEVLGMLHRHQGASLPARNFSKGGVEQEIAGALIACNAAP